MLSDLLLTLLLTSWIPSMHLTLSEVLEAPFIISQIRYVILIPDFELFPNHYANR